MEKRLQCETCKFVSYSVYKDNQLNLIAPIDSKCEKGTPVELAACLDRFFAQSIIDDVHCANCKKRTTFNQTYRFLRFPKVLCFVLQRFVFDDWVPKKLEIELQVSEDSIDFNAFESVTKLTHAQGE
jgi:ubiquitin carboxyl-terminal hydrolase 5/13